MIIAKLIFSSISLPLVLYFLLYFFQPTPIEVQVISHEMQRYAVWFGGSMLASTVGSGYTHGTALVI